MIEFNLTEEQRQIVQHDGGHSRVLAVAGSGKTFTMAHRINHLIQDRSIHPKQIRVLMFNRLAKEQFVGRLQQMQFHSKGMPYITTFHGFGYNFVNYYTKKGIIPSQRFWIGEEEERATILLHQVIRSLRLEDAIPKDYHPNGNFDIEEVKNCISLYKGSLIPPKRAGHHFNEFIPIIYERFEEERIKQNVMTFNDFIPEVIKLLELVDSIRENWIGKSKYLIIDEYQDVNYSQQRLIELLGGDTSEIMLVGDDDQTIYEWRGARPNYILKDFQTVFDSKPHSTYKLSNSFRFGPVIAQCAQNCIKHNTLRESKDLVAFKVEQDSDIIIKIGGPGRTGFLHRDMVQEIIRLVKKEHVSPQEIWGLGRVYSQLIPLEVYLLAQNVPYQVLGNTPFYKRSEIQKILDYFRLATLLDRKLSKNSIGYFLKILNFPNRRIPKKTVSNILEKGFAQGLKWIDALQYFGSDEGRSELELREEQYDKFEKLLSILKDINDSKGKNGKSTYDLIYSIIYGSDLKKHFEDFYGKGESSHERIAVLDCFLSFVTNAKVDANDLVSYIDSLDSTKGAPIEQQILLSTIHKTKGLEFDYVFIPNCVEGMMPCLINDGIEIFDTENPDQLKDMSANIENERKLFYVAITRAKKRAYIVTPGYAPHTKTIPSRFLEEIELESSQKLLKFIGSIDSWEEESISKWQANVIENSGKKYLLSNLKKYLIKIDATEQHAFVSKSVDGVSESPFKYKLAYPGKEKDISPGANIDLGYWGDVEED